MIDLCLRATYPLDVVCENCRFQHHPDLRIGTFPDQGMNMHSGEISGTDYARSEWPLDPGNGRSLYIRGRYMARAS